MDTFQVLAANLLWLAVLCLAKTQAAEAAASDAAVPAHVYVAESPAGNGDGSSAAHAKSVSFFNAAANWGTGAGQIGPGTTIHLCGTISRQLTAQGSGTSAAPLVIVFEPGAKISMPKSDTANGCLNVSNCHYLVVDGGADGTIENTANGTDLRFHVPARGIKAMACDHCEFENLRIRNLYVHAGVKDATDLDLGDAFVFSGSHIRIHGIHIHDVHWALVFAYGNGDTDIDVYENDIARTDHGFTVGGYGTTVKASGIKFHHNHVHDYANWDTTRNAYHHDGVHAYATAPAAATDLRIYNNLFDGDTGANLTGHIFLESGTSPWSDHKATSRIFNNVLVANSVSNTGVLNVGMGDTEVYNNVVIGNGTGLAYGVNNLVNAHFKNNIAIRCESLVAAKKITGVVDFDYNAYFQPGRYNAFVWNQKVYTPSLDQWRSACGGEAHSIYPRGAAGINMATGRPQPFSPVIGAGVNLSDLGIADLAVDKDGNARPHSGSWDAGAYVAVHAEKKPALQQ